MVAVPRKFSVGVKMTFVPEICAVPLVGFKLTRLNVPPSVRNVSFTSGLKVFVVFSAMLPLSGFASGGMFVTVIVMTEELVPPTLSVMV